MEKKVYAKLFNSYEFVSQEHLDMYIQTMDDKVALHTLISSIKAAYERGAFHIGEVEVISKAIRIVSEPKTESKEESV